MAYNSSDLAKIIDVDKLAQKVSAKLNVLNNTTFKAVVLDGNAIHFYASSDTTQTPADTIDIPAEQFVDQLSTGFVPNFTFSGLIYGGATNPNLDGKPVLVLGIKSRSNDDVTETISYSFIDMSSLVDVYTASDTSIIVANYNIKVNISPTQGNFLKLTNNGLYVEGMTDTATALSDGLMSAEDKAKLDGISDNANNYTLPAATSGTLGGVKIGSNISVSNGTISLSSANVTSALGYTPPTTNTTYSIGNATTAGISKLYTGTGTATDGTMTQAAIKTALDGKLGSTAKAASATTADSATKATQDSAGNVITDTYVTKTELKDNLPKRYGYRIKKNESDPYARVEYLYDAVGMTPAHMDFTNGFFDYGSWADVWFVKDNKPLMLKSDGSVDYFLDPNDYTKKENSSETSDVANTNYDGNAMARIPLCWVKRYEDDNYLYEIVSPIRYDDDYKAYAHTDANGNIKDYFYNSMFGASGNSTKLRSISGQTLSQNLTTQQQINAAVANGSGWYIGSWSQRNLINTLLVLLGKSTNTQAVFGNGSSNQNVNYTVSTSASNLLQTGTLKDKGQFFGYNTVSNSQVKVFHIEGWWGDQWLRTAGLINNYGTIYAKMTPEGQGYRVDDVNGYTKIGPIDGNANGNLISAMRCNEYGLTPTAFNGSDSTYYCDASWSNDSRLDYLFVGGGADNVSAYLGAVAFDVTGAPSRLSWNIGCALSFV